MTRERWGTFSVIDHVNASSFVPEILLYDRLVVPVPFSDEDKKSWVKKGWKPDLLEERLERLGDLAIAARWDKNLKKQFRERIKDVKADAEDITEEAQKALPYQLTRRMLAQKKYPLPAGVTHTVVVAAYQSEKDFSTDFLSEAQDAEESRLGLLLGQKLAVPVLEGTDKDVLSRALDLARKEDFKRKRRKLYEWQEDVLKKGIDPERAAAEMDKLIKDYNACVRKAARKVHYNFAFTLGIVAIGVTGFVLGNPLGLASAAVGVAKYVALDRKIEVKADDECKPAAMFHDVKNSFS